MEAFQVGDVVKLKSGGPKMTVHGLYTSAVIECIWFDGGVARKEKFSYECLESCKKPKRNIKDKK